MDDYGTQSMERKKKTRMDTVNQFGADQKRKVDNKCQLTQRKDVDQTNQCVIGKKKKVDYNPQSMQQKNTTHPEKNQTTSIENEKTTDYESKFEASRKRLHKAYKREEEAKRKRSIEVIDFQKSETQGSKGKAKTKPSLRQKLMAMPTRKNKKKFPPYEMLRSCN